MYIVELFIKIKQDFKDKKGTLYRLYLKFEKFILKTTLKLKKKDFVEMSIQDAQDDNEQDIENCDHIFVPVDSTGKVLACTKCGEILKVEDKTNPF